MYWLVAKLCLTLCDPMDWSMPGFPVLHHLPEFAQTHVHYPFQTTQGNRLSCRDQEGRRGSDEVLPGTCIRKQELREDAE